MRVPAILFGALIVPIGLLYVLDLSYVERLVTIPFRRWYGWSAEAKTHWIMPIIGTTIFGFGAMMTLYALSRKLTVNVAFNVFFQSPYSPLPRGHFYIRSICVVRGIGTSLTMSFIRCYMC
jgi:hypothetical protein